jgi:hypothetical protein
MGGPALLLTRISGWDRGGLELFGVAPVDHHFAAGLGQRARTGLSKAAARCANNGLAAGDSEIHGILTGVMASGPV